MESLIKAGAMDIFGRRPALLIAFPEIVNRVNIMKKSASDGQVSLFDADEPTVLDFALVDVDDFTQAEKLSFEKEFLGFYLTSHPYTDVLNKIKPLVTHELELLEEEEQGQRVKVGGIVESAKRILTKKTNSEMAFLTISNEKGSQIECIVFPKVYDRFKGLLLNDTVVMMDGRLDNKNDKMVIIVDSVSSANVVVEQN
jgi:DNA polymerase-3 subunit alpha